VIDATERITTENETSQGYPYREAKPTAGARSGSAQLYEFTLAGARAPDEGAFVQVTSGGANTRGQVTRVTGMTVTIRFDEPVDWNDLQGQGEITTTPSTVVYRMQREAVGQLRSGRARNPGVLAALVDRQAQPPNAGQRPRQPPPRPAFPLNPHQREAFEKTLARPAILAVIGPPGTGKTTTIAEIVRATEGSGERVIICSQNNRAVDNVLGRLPRELLAIRVGNESRVTAEGVPYLLQRQAADLRGQALRTSRRNLDAYAGLGQAEGWADELARRNAALKAARGAEAQALSLLDSGRRAAGGPATEEVDRLAAVQATREWVDEASGESDQLHPELIRYADVLAATCTGAGSRPELADLDFDLAIVDEAGQIGVADALIPLARARRAVLVGDHMQLPPFLDSDVEAWGRLVGDPVVRGMLAKSALEMVVEALPAGSPNVVWLTEQRRMPEVIAKFASAQFYGGRLETPPGLREHRDELFRFPLAFVDTSALDWAKRRDRSGRARERWGQQGYDNPEEARLLADLAIHYDQAHQDWAVIVPYLAQAELIRRMLTGHAGDAEKVRLNVGTVDSFQGGERDVILYGFTRSNPERRVGFLRELRRVNVAITRARQQLVLVGDLETLTSAKDEGFRGLAGSLRDYVAGSGEIISCGMARSRLRAGRTAR
jgi:hypothetical protein